MHDFNHLSCLSNTSLDVLESVVRKYEPEYKSEIKMDSQCQTVMPS